MKKIAAFERLVKLSTFLSASGLVVMLLISVADVTMDNLFRRPIVGTFDLVEAMLVLVVFCGFPMTFLASTHIAVDVIDFFVSKETVRRLKLLAKVLSFGFLAFLAWEMMAPAYDAFRFGERKQELGLPLWVLWVPMIAGIALAAVAALISIVQRPGPDGQKE